MRKVVDAGKLDLYLESLLDYYEAELEENKNEGYDGSLNKQLRADAKLLKDVKKEVAKMTEVL